MTPITATNDFVIKFANVNGSGSASASANEMFANPPISSFSRLREKVPKADEGAFDLAPMSSIKAKHLTRPFGPPSPGGRGEI